MQAIACVDDHVAIDVRIERPHFAAFRVTMSLRSICRCPGPASRLQAAHIGPTHVELKFNARRL